MHAHFLCELYILICDRMNYMHTCICTCVYIGKGKDR